MANQQPKAGGGGGGRWGSFFTQAVAGMEAQLDSMLAEGEGSPATGRLPKKENDPPSRQPTPSNAATTNAPKAKPAAGGFCAQPDALCRTEMLMFLQ